MHPSILERRSKCPRRPKHDLFSRLKRHTFQAVLSYSTSNGRTCSSFCPAMSQLGVSHITSPATRAAIVRGLNHQEGVIKPHLFFFASPATHPPPPCPSSLYPIPPPLCPLLILPVLRTYRTQRVVLLMVEGTPHIGSKGTRVRRVVRTSVRNRMSERMR